MRWFGPVPAAVCAGLMLAACAGSTSATVQPSAAAVSPSAPPTPAVSTSPVATNEVDIVNFAFSPAVITVRVGTTVRWTNQDQDAHTVAIAGAPVSDGMQNADTYTHTFTQAGTFTYICSIHPYMRGMVIVTSG
jgi:plastocyanin